MASDLAKKIHIHSQTENILSDLDILNCQYDYSSQDESHEYKPFSIRNLQKYNPIYSLFFEMNESNHHSLSLKHKNNIVDLHTIMNMENIMIDQKPSFVKFSPLLDPVKYMIGKYNVESDALRTLPSAIENNEDVFPKLVDHNNSAYIDCFFSFLTSQLLEHHGIIHGLDFYGSFLGIQNKYKMNVTDDIEYIAGSDYFHQNLGKHFFISDKNYSEYSSTIAGSRANKNKLHFSSLNENIDLEEIVIDDLKEKEYDDEKDDKNSVASDHEVIYEKKVPQEEESYSSSDSEVEYSESDDDSSSEESENRTSESSECETSSENESSDEHEVFSYINNFPVQMICLEKCKGTMDDLFKRGIIDENTGPSALMQIIMTLVIYQKTFSFTHNDLHTNNIMYVDTEEEYIYYFYDEKTYKVPTYGKIFKIIDFGRGIYKFDGKTFCSDSFAPKGDAATQYNCEPYMNENKPRLDPNPSFDLCRLGCSIYDFVIDNEEFEEMDDFQKLILSWCLDDNGKNILYKRNGEERYPNFKLYKMITKTVHNCVPKEQLKNPLFSQYSVDTIENIDLRVINIDEIPCYC
jgi:hypothetical protein